jgi:hypothetical protein
MSDKEVTAIIGNEPTIDLIAGRHPNGELVIEKLLVNPQAEVRSFQLLRSPVFVRGIARADVIQQLEKPAGAFKVLRHSGNLCLRIFSKESFETSRLAALEQALTSELEKLGGDLDVKETKVLVYSIHVSCGFSAIEKILSDQLSNYQDVAWFYGNVYDPESGEPLNWWQSILAPD